MFRKIVIIEPVGLNKEAEKELYNYAQEVVFYNDLPSNDNEIYNRIGNADAILVSYTTTINKEVLEQCSHLKYIGMCCSLYSPESANVDIRYAEKRGITVTGIRDYGDEGVVEYVVNELVRCLHGFGLKKDRSKREPWNKIPEEITGLQCGIVGLGTLGGMIADGLSFFGAKINYFARSAKEDANKKGYTFLPLPQLLKESEVVICCLNKNTILLYEKEFEQLGNHKILFNVGLSPAWDMETFEQWINNDNICYCDSLGALGDKKLLTHPHVECMNLSAGRTRQAFDRLSKKVIENLAKYNG